MLFVYALHILNSIQARYIRTQKHQVAKSLYTQKYIFLLIYCDLTFKTGYLATGEYVPGASEKKKKWKMNTILRVTGTEYLH